MSGKKYLVYRLVLNLSVGRVETGIRVFDIKSLMLLQSLYKSKSFGRIGRNSFMLVLHQASEDLWEKVPSTAIGIPLENGRFNPEYTSIIDAYANMYRDLRRSVSSVDESPIVDK